MHFTVPGKTALITGSNRGIGKAILDTLLEKGAAKVYAAVRDPGSMAEAAATSKGRVVPLEIDLGKPETIRAAAEKAKDVHLVVNNAGVFKAANPLSPEALSHFEYEIDINVRGLLRMAQAFAPALAANGGGAFVQLNSVASLKNFADFATYSASKAAAYSLTQALREVFDKQGTQVVSVHPGPIATDMAKDAGLEEIAEPASLVAEAIVDALEAGEFHSFPDSMARMFWENYRGFAEAIVEANPAAG